jgi:hypothetical protein
MVNRIVGWIKRTVTGYEDGVKITYFEDEIPIIDNGVTKYIKYQIPIKKKEQESE